MLGRWILTAALLLAATPAVAAKPIPGYNPVPGQTCGGYPRAPMALAPGFCAGVVVSPPPAGLLASKRQLHLPRTMLALPGGDFLVVDLGAWIPARGAVWRLTPHPGAPPTLTRLLSGLDMPHEAALGPDGKVYLGEMSRIVRFDPDAADPAGSIVVIEDGLPSNRLHPDRHPLTSFIFDADGALLVNVGAATDQCNVPPPAKGATCAEREGDRPHAAIWRFAYQGAGAWSQTPNVFARGLRNSMGLVRHSSGNIYQAENGIDLTSAAEPFDAINHVVQGGDYGWPYCMDMAKPAPAWLAMAAACKSVRPPIALLPPHGAPLDLAYYHGPMFPELEGRLLVTLHGYRATGSRLLALEVDAAGAPVASATAAYEVYRRPGTGSTRTPYRAPGVVGLDLTPNWDTAAGKHPAGAPVAVAIAADGAIWVVEDRTGAMLRIARDGP